MSFDSELKLTGEPMRIWGAGCPLRRIGDMKIELTDVQERQIALAWIKAQQDKHEGYKVVLDTLLMGATFAVWSWIDALKYAVRKCGKAYFHTVDKIMEI